MVDIVQAPDGQAALVCKQHSKEKIELVKNLAGLFCNGMKGKWNHLFYIDLFAGPGMVYLEQRKEFEMSCGLSAASLQRPFDSYHFCDIVPENISALKGRIEKSGKKLNVNYYIGDANIEVRKIKAALPPISSGHTSLGFCFVDPFGLSSFKFSTLELLTTGRYMDVLILLPTFMEANRFEEQQMADPQKLADFCGQPDWVEQWKVVQGKGGTFGEFIQNLFSKSMLRLKYKEQANAARLIKVYNKNVALYHLAFYSRNDRGYDFFNKANSQVPGQMALNI